MAQHPQEHGCGLPRWARIFNDALVKLVHIFGAEAQAVLAVHGWRQRDLSAIDHSGP
jgi:hypothetical protein